MATTKFSVGDLVYQYASGKNLNYQFHAGIAQENPAAGSPADEEHVKVRLLNGHSEWMDVSRYGSAGKPYRRRGRVVIKWLKAENQAGQPLDEMRALVGQHEQWNAEMFTDTGWALAQDPWGERHWLPPRRKPGVDSVYVFYRGDVQDKQRYVVTMQQTGLPPSG